MELEDELRVIAEAAVAYAVAPEELAGIVPTEPGAGRRLYLCGYRNDSEQVTSWLVLDRDGRPVDERRAVRDAVSISALCELADEAAGGGDLDDLRSRLVALRMTEGVEIAEAEAAIDDLEAALGTPPKVASPQRLDAVGEAARRLEQALGDGPGSPFVEAMKASSPTIDALTLDVEATYKLPLA